MYTFVGDLGFQVTSYWWKNCLKGLMCWVHFKQIKPFKQFTSLSGHHSILNQMMPIVCKDFRF